MWPAPLATNDPEQLPFFFNSAGNIKNRSGERAQIEQAISVIRLRRSIRPRSNPEQRHAQHLKFSILVAAWVTGLDEPSRGEPLIFASYLSQQRWR
ncbi:MAG TPA: hypothetical protein EYQ22_04485 [Gammaproteobacteria bacterium]|nr:hypothetical protein [Gammaproteobacteria bacterium]HIK70406.1 hypothetical protein [Pseudomonadales bacterium]